jgi:hypothetical protein
MLAPSEVLCNAAKKAFRRPAGAFVRAVTIAPAVKQNASAWRAMGAQELPCRFQVG